MWQVQRQNKTEMQDNTDGGRNVDTCASNQNNMMDYIRQGRCETNLSTFLPFIWQNQNGTCRQLNYCEPQGWCSQALAGHQRGSGSQTRRHMLVEFVGSLLCSKSFSSCTPVFSSPQKPSFKWICLCQFTVSLISVPLYRYKTRHLNKVFFYTSIKFFTFQGIVHKSFCIYKHE